MTAASHHREQEAFFATATRLEVDAWKEEHKGWHLGLLNADVYEASADARR